MSEMPGASAVAIESVEWSSESSGNLSVRITGRWRRRRPVSSGQPTLVIEAAEGRRDRFPAMPEPPSVGGTGPGVWRLSFTVPSGLAPELGRTWLQFGTVIVPLPVAVPAPSERPASRASAPTALSSSADEPVALPLALQREPGELAEPPDGEDAPDEADLTRRVDVLEEELQDARAVRDELAASLEERERKRRIAEQRAHAEQALRRDLARRLSTSTREAERAREAMGDLAAAEERIRVLEHELGQARRRSDEAEQVAAAATVARQRAERERELAQQKLQRRGESAAAETARLRFEQAMRGRRAGEVVRIPAEPVAGEATHSASPLSPPSPGVASSPRPALLPRPLVPPRPPAPAGIDAASPASAHAVSASPGVVASLRAELGSRTREDAALRARVIDAESRLAARVLLEQRTAATLSELRAELGSLGDELVRERLLRADAERRAAELERELQGQRAVSLGAYIAIGELREALQRLAPPEREPDPADPPAPVAQPDVPAAPEPPARTELESPPPLAAALEPPALLEPPLAAAQDAPAPAAGLVEPARLNDALSRLRDTVAPQDAPGPPIVAPAAIRPPSLHEALARPTLERAFRAMARADLDAAGRLLLELLPLQHVVYPHAVTYDLVLGPDRCVWVSVADGAPAIEVQGAPRPREEVDFRVVGEPRRIARMLTAGWLGRWLGRAARVRGRRQGVVAISALLGAPLDLGALHRAGVRPDPVVAFRLLAAMIDPSWTAPCRFTLEHSTPDSTRTYLLVQEGRPLTVRRDAPQAGATTTLSCPGEHLLAALAGAPVPGVRVTGDVEAFLSLRRWIKRAQSE
ncbi:MAG: hypothetical protein ACJ780_18920 [Solirubrobacteraceae bacterium]